MTCSIPQRKHNIVHGLYAKVASNPDNLWTGILDSHKLPSVVNPAKGYIVNTNNKVTSHRDKIGVFHNPIYFSHRAARISELLEGLIANAEQQPIRVKEI